MGISHQNLVLKWALEEARDNLALGDAYYYADELNLRAGCPLSRLYGVPRAGR